MSRIPEVSTGKLDSIGNISGIALQILYQPLIEKTQTKRLLYGDLLQTLNSHMLELMQEEADIENEVKWQSLLPSDPKQEAEVAQIYDALGVSKHTIYTGIGIDYDKEIKLLEEENKDNANLGEQIINTFNQGALNDPNNPYNQGTQPNPSPSTANQDQGQ